MRSPRFARDDNSKTTNTLQKILFFLVIFCIPFQVGYHFWPEFSYVQGVRIDYLSPTLYLLDILIIIWVALGLLGGVKGALVKRQNRTLKILLSLFVLDLILNVFLAKSLGAHIFGIVKLSEFGVFGWLVARTFKKQDIPIFVRILAGSGIVSAVLAIWQFINQSSAGGLWYLIGERTFSLSTIGISTVNLDHQILRAYGAFPHPNVLAFFFLATCVFTIFRLPHERSLGWRIFLIVSALLCLTGLILTFSRTAIVIAICFFIYAIYTKGRRNLRRFTLGFLMVVVPATAIFLFTNYSNFLLRGIDFRQELFSQSLTMFLQSPYFGIGINNFFINQAPLIKTISPVIFQPVHNIFALALLSLGLFGWWIVPAIFITAIKSVWQKIKGSRITNHESRDFYRGVLFVLISIVIAGMFDHFFLTVEQGQIMLALILGLSFSNVSFPDRFKKR